MLQLKANGRCLDLLYVAFEALGDGKFNGNGVRLTLFGFDFNLLLFNRKRGFH